MYWQKIRKLFLIFLVACILISCKPKNDLTINANQEEFTVSLPANPTTGFQWTIISYDKNIFDLINHQYITSKIGVLGAGGNTLFTFKIKKQLRYPNLSILKFKYARTWEPQSAIYKEIKVKINYPRT